MSAVARGDDALDDAVKDAEVVDAAHSKCGKMDDAADETDDDQDADEVEDADESDDAVTTPQDTPEVHESTGNPNQGNGNANRGNGNQGHGNSGNGNGKKND